MANTLTATPPKRASDRWLPAIGISLLIVFVIVVVGTLWLLNAGRVRAKPNVERDLLAAVDREAIPPHLALLMLAGYPAEQVWQEPLRKGQWDGSLAMWLFSPVRSDRAAIADLLALAEAQQRQAPDMAAACLLGAADVARISPELTDRERAEFVVTIGKQMHQLGLGAAAVTEWRQASILAHYGPSMPALYRATLLHDLAVLYKQVGARNLEARARQNSAQVGSSSDILAVPARIVLDTEQLPDEPPELIAARERRRAAAEGAARSLGTATEERAYAELRDALTAEGLMHRMWLDQELQVAHPREVQAALLLYHINWLQQERMLAWGAAGEHFPTWAERRPLIEASLHEAWDALEVVRMDQSIRQGVQERATLAQRDWWATRLIQARLTHDPTLDVQAVIASMVPNNADEAGQSSLRLDWIQGRFWRVPRENVGTNTLPE